MVRFALLLLAALSLCAAIIATTEAFSTHHQLRTSVGGARMGRSAWITRYSSSDSTSEEGDGVPSPEDDSAAPPPAPPPQQQARQQPPLPKSKPLDPLFVSLTKMDEETKNAPTMELPVWGELILDKSLIVLLPAAAFAVLGFVLSAYVALNVNDPTLLLVGEDGSSPPPVRQEKVATDGCRGLCSSQEQDLAGLEKFMKSLGKN